MFIRSDHTSQKYMLHIQSLTFPNGSLLKLKEPVNFKSLLGPRRRQEINIKYFLKNTSC